MSGEVPITSKVIGVHGHRIVMRVQGEGDPLLLINGMTRSLQSWEPFIRELSGRRTVVSFDAPGVGASPTPVLPISIPGLAALAAAVLDAAGLDDADVLGFSHGGAVAQQLACDHPARVRRLVLVSTSCGVGATPGRRRETLHALGRPNAGPGPLPDPLGMFWQTVALSKWSSIPFLGSIAAPTLVVCGTYDRIVDPSNSRVLARRIPGASLVMLPAGHDLQRLDPARALAGVVEDFFAAEGPGRRDRA
jgi:poly(3-hydroxyoctanoate) depolymerase